jgi:hypothetical protein
MLLLTERKSAIITGALFIVATLSALVGDGLIGSRLHAPEYLAAISEDRSWLIPSALFKFLAAATSAGIAMSLYPVLRKRSEGLAIGSVCFRIIEAVFYLVAALGLLSLVPLSQEYAKAEAAFAPQLQSLSVFIIALGNWSSFTIAVLAFCLGASMYYYAFLRARLVPRWLSIWGLASLALLLAMVVLNMLDGNPAPSGIRLLFAIPIALQEQVLALWLIVKGFNPGADKPL